MRRVRASIADKVYKQDSPVGVLKLRVHVCMECLFSMQRPDGMHDLRAECQPEPIAVAFYSPYPRT